MDEKTPVEELTRADRINRQVAAGAWATAIVALITALAPYALRAIHNIWQAPHATITNVTWTTIAKKHGPCSTMVTANGTADHIPAGDDLWLVARSNKSVWYPISPITHPSGDWAAHGTAGTSRITELDLRIISQAQDGQFVAHMKPGTDIGFNNAPAGPPPLTRLYVANERGPCLSISAQVANEIVNALKQVASGK